MRSSLLLEPLAVGYWEDLWAPLVRRIASLMIANLGPDLQASLGPLREPDIGHEEYPTTNA
jgi:hypothetical protein